MGYMHLHILRVYFSLSSITYNGTKLYNNFKYRVHMILCIEFFSVMKL